MNYQASPPVKTRASRRGARGVRKVKTGCSTCKTRHMKCDEARPACSNCTKAGWKCDFGSPPSLTPSPPERCEGTPPVRSLRYPSARPLLDCERGHMEYFQVVCAREFSIYYELPVWESIVLQGTLVEPTIHYAALAIGSLSRSRYHPVPCQSLPTTSFSIRQYNSAIQSLRSRLDGSPQSLELAILASVVFSVIEFLLELDSQIEVHIQSGLDMLGNLYMRHNSPIPDDTQFGANNINGGTPVRYNLLASAISQLAAQMDSFTAFQVARKQMAY
ncbi:hypothetical protein BX600DRAFT_457124 [Xylariales sp. PMI_506]|nr:hypothetical protein BX600DRAFT_457124 [Xylariales sp. PMI_506]